MDNNYPNPFNLSTTFEYYLLKSGHTKLSIYNLGGKLVVVLVNNKKAIGRHKVQWKANNLSSVFFISDSLGWAVGGYSTLLYTDDGGYTWEEKLIPVLGFLNSVFFTDKLNGLVVGDNGLILKTSNGGHDWIQEVSRTRNDLFSAYLINESMGWVAGDLKTIPSL